MGPKAQSLIGRYPHPRTTFERGTIELRVGPKRVGLRVRTYRVLVEEEIADI